MLLWATAAFMKRRSRMAQLMAAVPTAAQAACRMNSRRSSTEADFFSIMLFLNSEIGGGKDEMNNGANAIAHLGIGRSGVSQGGGVVDDLGLSRGVELATAEQGVERVHQPGDSRVGGVRRCHPGT